MMGKMRIYRLLFTFICLSNIYAYAQSSITGDAHVCANKEYTYVFTGKSADMYKTVSVNVSNGVLTEYGNSTTQSIYYDGPISIKVKWSGSGGFIQVTSDAAYIKYVTCYNPLSDIIPVNANVVLGNTIRLSASSTDVSTYKWKQGSSVLGTSYFIDVSPVVSTTYVLETTHNYSTFPGTLTCSLSVSRVVNVVTNPILDNLIGVDQVLCPGQSATSLTQRSGTSLSGGTGSFTFQWQQSVNNGSTWSTISGATNSSYSPGIITVKTLFRRIVYSGTTQNTSNVVTIDQAPSTLNLTSQTFSSNQLLKAINYVAVSGDLNTTSGTVVEVKAGKAISIASTSEINKTFLFTIESCSSGLRQTSEEVFESVWREGTNHAFNLQPFPNPVNGGVLNIGEKVDHFILYDSRGSVVREGMNTESILVDGIAKGIYFLKVGDQVVKIFVQ